MKGRPPRKPLSADQERAAATFIEAAEAPAAPPAPAPKTVAPTPSRPEHEPLPWEAPYVRDDVVKGYALRLPEPLYLKLKYVADRTGRSMNQVCRDAIESTVEAALRDHGAGPR